MIVSEMVGDDLIRHYSDSGKLIRQVETGVEYVEAVDLCPCRYTYEETDIDIEMDESEGEQNAHT